MLDVAFVLKCCVRQHFQISTTLGAYPFKLVDLQRCLDMQLSRALQKPISTLTKWGPVYWEQLQGDFCLCAPCSATAFDFSFDLTGTDFKQVFFKLGMPDAPSSLNDLVELALSVG